ncbi:hypothetical protein PoB_007470100 [Plakobranchus ocellatus]|uniref:C2H2-type domain-containing protein n=1 Tax=Plakobranchus ocellatus TaxID=259542 RepID=A0AAV4DWI5_9GAST|nr:hypothetical protein PoB_007470100 [Plakobranchus ocellatus]
MVNIVCKYGHYLNSVWDDVENFEDQITLTPTQMYPNRLKTGPFETCPCKFCLNLSMKILNNHLAADHVIRLSRPVIEEYGP